MSPKHRAAQTDAPADEPVDLRFVTQGLSAEEIAAATAVLTGALQEQAHTATPPQPVSGWARSARGVRQPLRGDWRGFTAEGL